MKSQIELAKIILENAGYKVSKMNENGDTTTYDRSFSSTNDTAGTDLSSRLADIINKSGATNKGVKKRAGNYHVSFECSSDALRGVMTSIENCGFFKSWIE